YILYHEAGAGALLLLRITLRLSQAERYLGQDRCARCRDAAEADRGSDFTAPGIRRPPAIRSREGPGAVAWSALRWRYRRRLRLWTLFRQHPGLRGDQERCQIRRCARWLTSGKGRTSGWRHSDRVRFQADPESIRFHLRPQE